MCSFNQQISAECQDLFLAGGEGTLWRSPPRGWEGGRNWRWVVIREPGESQQQDPGADGQGSGVGEP